MLLQKLGVPAGRQRQIAIPVRRQPGLRARIINTPRKCIVFHGLYLSKTMRVPASANQMPATGNAKLIEDELSTRGDQDKSRLIPLLDPSHPPRRRKWSRTGSPRLRVWTVRLISWAAECAKTGSLRRVRSQVGEQRDGGPRIARSRRHDFGQ